MNGFGGSFFSQLYRVFFKFNLDYAFRSLGGFPKKPQLIVFLDTRFFTHFLKYPGSEGSEFQLGENRPKFFFIDSLIFQFIVDKVNRHINLDCSQFF